MGKEPIETTINGIDMRVVMKIHKKYLKGIDADKYITLGSVTLIRYMENASKQVKYNMEDRNGSGIGKAQSIASGDIIFKEFFESTLRAISEEIISGYASNVKDLGLTDTTNSFLGEVSPGEDEENLKDVAENTNNFKKIDYFDELPYFDLIILSKDEKKNGNTKKKTIKDVKFYEVGSSEDTDSTEMNEIVKFISIGEITEWGDA